jgi:phosphate transport system protein
MGGLVESSVHERVLALEERRAQHAEIVWRNAKRINRLEIEIDNLATSLFALQQPIAGDQRFITTATKINTDLDRMGDLAVNGAQRAAALIEKPAVRTFVDIPQLVMLPEKMVRKFPGAFVRRDPDLARAGSAPMTN